MTKIMCTDGVKRTECQYNAWIRNLLELYEQEPGDLTGDEIEALEDAGCI